MSWEKVKLREVCLELASGGRPKGGAVASGVFSIGAEHLDGKGGVNISNPKFIPNEYYRSIGKGKVKTNDILIVKDGATTGKVSFIDDKFPLSEAAINEHVFRIEVDRSKIFPNYCFHYLSCNTGQRAIMSDFRGATVGGISKGILDKISIPLPLLPIQKRISEILDAANALKRKDQELLKKYDELAQAIFIDMFGDPVKNEKGWEVKKLKDISVKIHSGNTPKGGSNVYVKNGITFFRSQNVWKNNLIYDDIAFIDEKTHKSMSKSSLKHKDILMTKTGRINTENSSLGRAALFLGDDNSANVNGHVYLIRLQETQVHEFAAHILTSPSYRDIIREVCVGGIDKRQLNKDHIENFPIIYPSIKNQRRFAEILNTIKHQKARSENAARNSENLFNSLIKKAFNGELVS